MNEFDYKDYLLKIGIKKGDIIDVVSDLMSFMIYCRAKNIKFDANNLLEALKEIVGNEGTILIRTFSWAFCRGEPFDIQNTPSEVGSLGNIALKKKDFKRTNHPIYSWCVWGHDSEYLCKLNNIKSFGKDTPWDYLCNSKAKMLVLGNTQVTGLTVTHHLEQIANVPYRSEKVFESLYIDSENKKSIRRYSMFVKPLNVNIEERKDLMNSWWLDMLERKGAYKRIVYDNFLKGAFYYYKDTAKYILEDLVDNYARKLWLFEGEEGFNNPKINWNMACYYSIK